MLVREARWAGCAAEFARAALSAVLTPDEWDTFATLAANTDLSGLPPVIGCPDCADGGAESLTIVGDQSQSISFEHGSNVEPAAQLLGRIRALRARLTPEG